MPDVKNALAEHYATESLNARQLDEIKRHHSAAGIRRLLRRWTLPLALAAGTAIVAISVLRHESNKMMDPWVAAVAESHEMHEPVEAPYSDLSRIQESLGIEGWDLLGPEALPEEQWRVLGGAQAELNGIPGVRLKIVDKETGTLYSLFVIPRPPDIRIERPWTVDSGPSELRFWTEGELMYALVR